MAFSSNSGGGPMTDINTTPLVDVLLVLLIIFMITAPMMTHKMKANVPVPAKDVIPEDQRPTVITVEIKHIPGAPAQVLFEQSPIDLTALVARLRVEAQKPKVDVNLKTDMEVSYEDMARVMAAVRRSGIQNVRFDELQPK